MKIVSKYLFICATFVVIVIGDGKATVWRVTAQGDQPSLDSIVARAGSADTVVVTSATYHIASLHILRSIVLLGEGWPTLVSSGSSHLINVSSSNVVIAGFILTGVPVSFTRENAAILLDSVENCEIRSNRLIGNFFGIYIAGSHHCRIVNNSIVSNAANLNTAGNGIHAWKCHDIVIDQNMIEKHRDGIYLEFVTRSTITRNSSRNNLRYGLHFMFSDNCTYENNYFIRNGAGVAVMYSKSVDMEANLFQESWGGASYGLLLKDIKDSRVVNNRFRNNSTGIYMEGSDRILIDSNNLIANGWALRIMGNCVNSQIRGNNFIDNTFQVTTNSQNMLSQLCENYWSTYRGFDLDHDGFGDIPYRPISLFSLVVERNPPTLILLRSLLIDVLNLTEQVLPTLTPETLIDKKPLMRPTT